MYKKLAAVMTDFENHRTVLEHNSELFKKLTFFYAVNNYATLFYVCNKDTSTTSSSSSFAHVLFSIIFYWFHGFPLHKPVIFSSAPPSSQPAHNRLLLSRGQPRGALTR